MKIKGFTLIELLAVIVILAIIALIATPIILNIIDDSKESAHKRSLELYKSAVEQAVTRHNLNNKTPLSNGDYMPNNDGTLLTLDDANNFKVSYSGNVVKCNVNINEGDITLSECTIDGSVVKNDVIVDVNKGETEEPKEEKTYVTRESENSFIYTFDDENNTSSQLYDLTGNENHATINSTTYSENGLLFNGSSSYGVIGDFNYQEFTIEETFMLNSLPSSSSTIPDAIITNQEYGGIYINLYNTGNQMYFTAGGYIDNDYNGVNYYDVEAGRVYTTTLVLKDKTVYFYVNGELIGTYEGTNELVYPDNESKLMIGANPNGSDISKADTNFFDGYVYSVRGYDSALTEEEIIQNYELDQEKYGHFDDIDLNKGKIIEYESTNENNTETVLYDISGNNNNGTIVNGVFQNNGLYFNGSSSTVKMKLFNSTNFTYTVKFKSDAYDSLRYIIGAIEDGGAGIAVESSNKITGYAYLGSGYYGISKTIDDQTQTYIVTITYNNFNFKMYVNGELVENYKTSKSFTYPDDSTILSLGANLQGTTPKDEYFKGHIYYASVYNRALLEGEIIQLHNEKMN